VSVKEYFYLSFRSAYEKFTGHRIIVLPALSGQCGTGLRRVTGWPFFFIADFFFPQLKQMGNVP
jgi:hypothetical protein